MEEELKLFAESLGIENPCESEESIACLRELKRCRAKIGPISTWFYEIKKSPECYKVFFSMDLIRDSKKNPKVYKVKNHNSFGCLESSSGSIMFDEAQSNDGKVIAIVALGHQLVQLDELEQVRMFGYMIDGTGYKISKELKEIGPGN